MSRYIPQNRKNLAAQVPNQISVYFHRHNLNQIKGALGTSCTYVGHARIEKNELVPKINKKGKEDPNMLVLTPKEPIHYVIAKFGKAKPIRAALNGTPNDIKAEYYAQLKNDLVNAARKRGIL